MTAARPRRWGHARLAGMREAATTARRGAALVIVAAPAAVAGYLALAFLSGVLPVAQVWLTKLVVDALTTRTGHAPPAASALALTALYALTFVVRTVVDPVEGMLIPGLQSRAAAEIDRRLMGVGARLVDLTVVETPAFADEVRLLRDTAYQLFWSVRALRNGISHALTLVGLALVLSRLQPLLPLALALAALPHAWAEGRAARVTYQAMADRSRAARDGRGCPRHDRAGGGQGGAPVRAWRLLPPPLPRTVRRGV